MKRESTPIPEPIAQLQRQLEQFRSTQPGRTKLRVKGGVKLDHCGGGKLDQFLGGCGPVLKASRLAAACCL
jgi:hypothetical protein